MSDAPKEKDSLSQQGATEEVKGGQLDALNMLPPACPPNPSEANHPNRPYRLPGPQVEPEAGYWTYDPRGRGLPRVVPVAEVLTLTTDPHSPYYVPPYPRDKHGLEWE